MAAAWLLVIMIAMLTPGDKFPEVDYFSFQDKLIHFICFALLTFLWVGVGVKRKEITLKSSRVWINFLIFGVLAGIVLEYAQMFVPFRSCDYKDMIANEIGAIVGLLAYFKIPTHQIGLH